MQLPAFGRKVSGGDACLDFALTSEGAVSVSQAYPPQCPKLSDGLPARALCLELLQDCQNKNANVDDRVASPVKHI